MAELKDILYKVSITSASGDMNIDVKNVCFDSRSVKPGSLFVAIKGTQSDGHLFINTAITSGAVAVVCEKLPDTLNDAVTFVTVKDSSHSLGIIKQFLWKPVSETEVGWCNRNER